MAKTGTTTPIRLRSRNAKVNRRLEEREPQVIEDVKTTMFIRGSKTNQTITSLMEDLYLIKKPHVVKYSKKNGVHPFEDATSLEFFSDKSDCGLFAFGSHTKKRPNNLVLGRLFDHHLLDMYELGIEDYKSLQDFSKNKGVFSANAYGSKPCFIFQGQDFNTTESHKQLQNLLLDFFRGELVESINLAGLDHIIVCSSVDEKIYFRRYAINLKKSGTKVPRVELTEIGPSFTMHIRRSKPAAKEVLQEAIKTHASTTPKKVKNVKKGTLGRTMATIHMGRQDISSMNVRRAKGLRGKRGRGEGEETGNTHSHSNSVSKRTRFSGDE
eukprot:TRINITY_DN1436_c0_g1_i1.p1 TRINITY_DN1436_c0_g1~~TRINITY_DN1436_c0_g1_i1.p1  ORF type:complete len:326 (+),score=58.36 TRINITY_DN1436_c0_g1_i1:213-1190(+)